MKLCKYFSLKKYSWRSIKSIKTVKGKLERTVGQFTPHSWTHFDWAQTKSFKGYCAILFIIFMEIICELNCFYLKYLLWIPVESMLNTYRLVFMFFLCSPAVREAYQFLNDPKCSRLGMNAWMAIVFNF